jgi:hypothetical protein
MSPEFEYFDWVAKDASRPLFALYDVFDNHFVILSYNYQNIYALKQLIRSKVILEIVELSQLDTDLDNSIVENWGLENPPSALYGDIRSLSKTNRDDKLHYEMIVTKNPILTLVNPALDEFKLDLQKQIFFFNFCLEKLSSNKQGTLDPILLDILLSVAESSTSYTNAVDLLLNMNYATTREQLSLAINFLRSAGLFYE